jgi:hypothetical protein
VLREPSFFYCPPHFILFTLGGPFHSSSLVLLEIANSRNEKEPIRDRKQPVACLDKVSKLPGFAKSKFDFEKK